VSEELAEEKEELLKGLHDAEREAKRIETAAKDALQTARLVSYPPQLRFLYQEMAEQELIASSDSGSWTKRFPANPETHMFHDNLLTSDERVRFHDAFMRLGDAVSGCLDVFLWVLEEVRRVAYEGRQDIHAAPLMLMFDFAEAIDGVAVLARSGSSKNCSQLLRTALEIQLSLRYMMEGKDTYEQRCLAYEFCHLQDQLRGRSGAIRRVRSESNFEPSLPAISSPTSLM
jgi:hypothetical protein